MRQNKNIALASLASLATLASAGTTYAAAFGPFSVGVGALRATNSVLQNQTGASNATSYLTIQRCSGVIETPVFVAAGASCTATTADYQIIMDVLSPTSTRVTIMATSATCDIRNVRFGTPNSKCAYDMTNPGHLRIGSGRESGSGQPDRHLDREHPVRQRRQSRRRSIGGRSLQPHDGQLQQLLRRR